MDAVTIETVRSWAKELAKLRDEAEDRQRRIDDLARKLDAAGVLGFVLDDQTAPPPVFTATVVNPSPVVEEGPTLRDSVLKALRDAGRGLTAVELRGAAVSAGYPAGKLKKNAGYLYTMLGRMKDAGQIQKRGEKYSIPA